MSAVRTWEGHHGSLLDTVNGYDVIACEQCGFRHIVAVPTEAELAEYYRKTYYTGNKQDYIARQQEDLEWWELAYAARLDLFAQRLGGKPGRILDVGCGPGFFLRHARNAGWATVGVEPADQAAEHARSLGLEVVQAPLSEAFSHGLGQFDVVYSHGVLEHLREPLSFMATARELLVAGGLLFVSVANDYNPLQQVLRESMGYPPWWLVPPQHINYFDLPTLRSAVERSGFEIIHNTATFPMELFLLMGDDYIRQPALGRASHGRRRAMELALARGNPGLLSQLYESMAALGIGRQLEITARKGPPRGPRTTSPGGTT